MRSIGVLGGIGKKKRMGCCFHLLYANAFASLRIFTVSAIFCLFLPGIAVGADATLSTRNNESTIGREPASGNRVMSTPAPRPQEGVQGPQTIIVSPEIRMDGYPGSEGNRPQRPRSR